MAEVGVDAIARFLANDKALLLEWEFFYAYLQLVQDNGKVLSSSYEESANAFSLLEAIIKQFIAEKGAQARVRCIMEAMQGIGHKFTSDFLQQQFHESARIVCAKNTQKEPDGLTHRAKILQSKTSPSAISILRLLPNGQSGDGCRVLIVIRQFLKILKEIGDRPVTIVSINGKQRSGKSFLATQFIKYLKNPEKKETWLDEKVGGDFHWKESHDRVTSGIQVWFEPFIVPHDGREYAVIVMDTQGLHDPKTSTQENAVIFGFSLLLSSIFIFNEMGMAEDSLQHLHNFLEFTKCAGTQVKFQKLIMLLRDWRAKTDFSVGYYDDNHCPVGESRNLKRKTFDVSPEAGLHKQAVDTRLGIQKCFEEIGVYAMNGPGDRCPDSADHKESYSWSPEFRRGVVDFTTRVFSSDNIAKETKRLFGREASALELILFLEEWTEQIQKSGGLIEFKSVFETTAILHFNKRIEALLTEYDTKMKRQVVESEEEMDFEGFHEMLCEELEAKLTSGNVFGGEEILKKYISVFRKGADGRKEYFDLIFKTNRDQRRTFEDKERANEERYRALVKELERLEIEGREREACFKREMELHKNDLERREQMLRKKMAEDAESDKWKEYIEKGIELLAKAYPIVGEVAGAVKVVYEVERNSTQPPKSSETPSQTASGKNKRRNKSRKKKQ